MAEKRLEGIGGWLLVFLIGNILAAISLLVLFVLFKGVLALDNSTGMYTFIGLLFGYFIIFVLKIIFMFNVYKKYARKIIIGLGILGDIGMLIYTVYDPTLASILISPVLIWSIICTIYLLKSQRVKNTFVK